MWGWNASAWLAGVALKSVVILGAAWLLAFALRRQSAAARHLVWTAAAVALLALPILSLTLPAVQVRSRALGSFMPMFQTTAVGRGAAPTLAALQASHAISSPANFPRRPDLAFWLPRIWAGGALIGLAHMLIAWAAMRRLRRVSRRLTDDPLFYQLRWSLDLHDEVDLIELPAGAMPLNFGVLRPAVFVPAGSQQWTEERRRVVLLHELAHVKRGDVATNLLARAAVCLYWWNPLVWTAWRNSVQERERAADDLVLAAGECATGYASHLLEIARSMQQTSPVAWAAIAMARRSQLEGRLLAILDSRAHRMPAGPRSAIAAGLFAILLVAPFAAVRAQEKLDPATAPVVEATIRTATAQNNQEITDAAAAAFTSSHKYEAAAQLLQSSLSIRAKVSGDHSSAYAIGLMKLGELSEKQNKIKDAVDFYTRAVALGDTPETAPGLIFLASRALSSGDLTTANSLSDRALAVAPSGSIAGRASTVKGDVALANGLAGVAETQYLRALDQEGKDSPETRVTVQRYAVLLASQNRSEDARSLRERYSIPTNGPRFYVGVGSTGTAGDRTADDAAVLQMQAQDPPAGVYRVGSGVSAPVLLYKKEPAYTDEAQTAKQQGTVVLYVQITPDGNATNMKVIKSLGLGLDQNAMEAVSHWKFAPGKKNGLPVTVEATIEVNFRLQ